MVLVLFPGSLLSILKWLKENEYETLLHARHVLYCKDWLKFKLTNSISTDETDGSIPFLISGTDVILRIYLIFSN